MLKNSLKFFSIFQKLLLPWKEECQTLDLNLQNDFETNPVKDICEIKDEKNELLVVEGSELKESLSVLPSTCRNLQGNTY